MVKAVTPSNQLKVAETGGNEPERALQQAPAGSLEPALAPGTLRRWKNVSDCKEW